MTAPVAPAMSSTTPAASSPALPSGDDATGRLPSPADTASDRGRISPVLLGLGVESRGFDPSIGSLASALESRFSVRELVADRFPDIFYRLGGDDGRQLGLRGGDVLFTFGGRFAAGRAAEFTVLLKPSQRYRELVAAVAAHLQLDIVQVHDWPVLSVDGGTPTVSEAAGVSIPGSGAALSQGASGTDDPSEGQAGS